LRAAGLGESYSARDESLSLYRCAVVDFDHHTSEQRTSPTSVPPETEAAGGIAPSSNGVSPDRPIGAPTSSRVRALFLAKVGRLLVESLDYEGILQQVADAAVPKLADWCAVDVVHPQAAGEWPPVVRRVAVAGRDAAQLAWARKLGADVERDWGSPNGLPLVLRTGLPSFFPNVTDDLIRRAGLSEQEKAVFLRIGLRSAICVPLIARGRTFGAISLGMAESRRRYDTDDLSLAQDLARYAAIAIDNARLYADERAARVVAERAVLRLERLQSVTAALSSARTPQQVGEVIVGHGLDALGACSALVYIVGAPGSALDLVGAAGYPSDALDRVRRISITAVAPVAQALGTRTPVILPTMAERRARYPDSVASREDVECTVAIPLMADDRGIGAMSFEFLPGATVGPYERTLLAALAHQCAQAIDRARLYVSEMRAKDAIAAVQRRQATVLEAIADGFVTFDCEWRYGYVNRVAADLMGRHPEDLIGRVLWEVHPGSDDTPFARALRDAMTGRNHAIGETYSSSVGRWIEYRAYPTEDGLSLVFRDIEERRRHDERLRFLAEASTLLSSSLEYETTLSNIAELAVPALASSCVIDLVGADSQLERVATVFDSGELSRLVGEFRQRNPITPESRHPARDVLATGESIFYSEITPAILPLVVDDRADSLALARRLNPTSCVFVALRARGRTLGVMSLSTTGTRRRFDELDRALIEELAQRVAMAVDNARLHDAERRARAEAEAANQAKSDFLAIMSHELRTPLTAVVGYTELLADEVVGPVNDTQRDHLARVRASSEHLLMLIEDILSFARIEAGREHVRIEDFGLAALLEQASAIVRPLAEKKSLEFTLVGHDSRAVMRSDPQKVRQIIINLLANAVKFTPAGAVRLSARVHGDRVEFEVADTGPGIAREHLERVFDAFWQVDQRMTRRSGGTGLGLSVARQLGRLLGGNVSVRSTIGEGSVFTVDLPLSAPVTAVPN
jgi:PAS domain S-box-containing protein